MKAHTTAKENCSKAAFNRRKVFELADEMKTRYNYLSKIDGIKFGIAQGYDANVSLRAWYLCEY